MARLAPALFAAALLSAAQPESIPIASPKLRATIVPDKGGEMASLQVLFRGQWVETLYRALDYSDKPGWTGKAPFLWPATGRNFPKGVQPNEEARNSSYNWNGKRLPMPIHGFARDLPWRVESKSRDRVQLSLSDSDTTRKSLPFGFRIVVDYQVKDANVSLSYTVTAAGSNTEPMPFSAGNHITFKTPLIAGGDPMKMEFESPSTVEFLKAAGGVPTGERRPRSFAKAVPLNAIEKLAAVSLGGYTGDPYMLLRDPAGLAIRMSHTAASVPQDPVIRFNVWGDPGAGYFSPEPWVGLQNSFNLRQGLIWLDPGKTWTWRIDIKAEGL
ncbi:MAG: hypothetical protein FJW39_19050 [Acidobacteria bacterium]|nr:hypothetical protein [Acidobacteriota bacterium]